MQVKKIHIIGSVGSGKTTLAKKLSIDFNIPHYELDNVVWKRFQTGDVRRSEKERDIFLRNIVNSDAWINEGVHYQWVTDSFVNAELIIFLDTRFSIRTYRIIKRYLLQQLGLEKSNYKSSFSMFMRMFRWNTYFEKVSKREIIELLKEFDDKVIIIRDHNELETYLRQKEAGEEKHSEI
ncbi:DNA topology modulation protein FlaR [Robertmurraya korlensis]|uniref:DNA topology modulation protein FlaR n=1 Tax=Robertmurraya korlensis TaxID=519977 RepID=UPI00204196F1|nr:DNA topology modulation protein FlaR [Robertmurraya korlensis]MCM3600009.1 DNA topology modulation protein FlaR [Robertmurraya korlensis]